MDNPGLGRVALNILDDRGLALIANLDVATQAAARTFP